MIYLTYNNQACQDGIGAQIQRILSIYWIAKIHQWGYVHSPILATEHNITFSTIERFNANLQLPSDLYPQGAQVINMAMINVEIIKRKHLCKQDVLFRITFAHRYLDYHREILSQPYPYQFPWVQKDVQDPLVIAVHIRRGDVSPTQNKERYVPLQYYMDCLTNLQQILMTAHMPYRIHIHSEQSIKQELTHSPAGLHSELIWHLDEDVNETFTAFVNADILFTGFSSLSYAASLIRQKKCLLYTPFWHQYSHQAIRLDTPNDILTYQLSILTLLQST